MIYPVKLPRLLVYQYKEYFHYLGLLHRINSSSQHAIINAHLSLNHYNEIKHGITNWNEHALYSAWGSMFDNYNHYYVSAPGIWKISKASNMEVICISVKNFLVFIFRFVFAIVTARASLKSRDINWAITVLWRRWSWQTWFEQDHT